MFQLRRLWRRWLYHRYLRSPSWWRRRMAVMMRAHFRCELCGAPATQVHHQTYAHVFHEELGELTALCRPCHAHLGGYAA